MMIVIVIFMVVVVVVQGGEGSRLAPEGGQSCCGSGWRVWDFLGPRRFLGLLLILANLVRSALAMDVW